MSTAAQPDLRRAHRSVATWLTGVAATALVSLAGFFATPFLVRWLGDTPWGAWTVIGEWLGYLGLSQLALGPGALTIFLLRAHTSEEGARALTAMARRGLRLYLWAALALLPLAAGLAWWAPHLLQVGAGLGGALRWAVAIAAVGSLALTPPLLFRSVLETVQRGYLVRAAILIQSLLITALSLWWVWAGWGLVGMAAASIAGMAVGALLWRIWAGRFLPQWRGTAPARLPLGEIWNFNWPLVIAMAGNQINQLTDNTVVGVVLGPAAVTGFALTQALPLLAGARLTDIGAVSWAALGELRQRDHAAFSARIVELAAAVLGVGLVLMALVGSFTPAFVRLWVGAEHFDGLALTWATAAALAVFGFVCFFGWLLDTQGDARRRLKSSTAGAAINLGLSLWWARQWGVAGVACGTLAAYLLTDAWYLPRLAVRLYGLSGTALAAACAAALVRGGVGAALVVMAARLLPQNPGWAGLIVNMTGLGAAAGVYCWFLVLRAADRAAWRERWRELRRPRAAGSAA